MLELLLAIDKTRQDSLATRRVQSVVTLSQRTCTVEMLECQKMENCKMVLLRTTKVKI